MLGKKGQGFDSDPRVLKMPGSGIGKREALNNVDTGLSNHPQLINPNSTPPIMNSFKT